MSGDSTDHFKGKEAIEHVTEAQVQGIVSSAEIHGTEIPGHISAATDAAKETSIAFLLIWIILQQVQYSNDEILLFLLIFSSGWIVWKIGRSAWLAWSRLERLHRVIAEERWEIEHHRQQERDELRVLYQAKGFEGKLLEEVLDVLMADNDRLLKVMLEEELGLALEVNEHPLKQSFGAGIGTLVAIIFCSLALWFYPQFGLLISTLLLISVSAGIAANHEKNRLIPAVVWNLGLTIFSGGSAYFLLQFALEAIK